jgi:hypothetical protein
VVSFGFQQPQNFDTNAKMRACFIYGFTRSFEWPESKKANTFVIYVVGTSDALVAQLKNLAATKKVGTQDIEIKNSGTFDPSIASNIIYFAPDNELKSVGDAASKNKNKGTLVVAETGGAAKSGASINFIFIENKLKFEYNKNSAVKAGLETKEDFKKLAAVVID